MNDSPFPHDLLEEVDRYVEWEDVARALAMQLISGRSLGEALEDLDQDACAKLDEETRCLADDADASTGWEIPYAAAKIVREAGEDHPEISGAEETRRLARKLVQAQRLAAEEARDEDPARNVLISPRIRDNVIERIVQTYRGHVVAEYLHSSAGWMRHRVMDLREILERGVPVPARVADAMSRERGELDELPTEEIAARLVALDPDARFSDGPDIASSQIMLFPELNAAETIRITEAELRDPTRHVGRVRHASDATNAEIAAEVLEIIPARWNSATLVATAHEDPQGFFIRIHGEARDQGCYLPTARLRLLVARRFEMMECEYDSAWRRFVFRITRADHPEWHCELSYDFSHPER